ncbi:xanthine dehydrogenase family protein molybdopterin-binding subunit, partial [Escherichia coli]
GKPIDRYEAREKVSGAAPYAFEQAPENTAYLAVVQASIGRGRVTGVDPTAAQAAPGVIAVIHGDPRMPTGEGNSRAMSAIGKDEVFHYGQCVAIVVAETQETARAAARLVTVNYEETAGRFDAADVEIQQDHKLGFLP